MPWRLNGSLDCSVVIISWEQFLDAFRDITHEPFAGDLAQFEAMYRVLNGDVIVPPTTEAELLAWRDREAVYVTLIDRVTRRLVGAVT